jgi:TolB protein
VKRIIMMVALLVLFTASAPAQDAYLEVTAAGSGLLSFAVATPVKLEGSETPEVSREVADALAFDMTLSGLFQVASKDPERGGIRPGEFSYAPWKAAGVKFVVKSGYSVAAPDRLMLELRLYDVLQEKLLTSKRFTGSAKDVRRMAHAFSDEILRTMTGEAGPFTGKIAFVSKRTGNKEIYLMDYDGRNVQQVTKNKSINLNPDFFPNGREIIYTTYKNRNPDLYRRELTTGAEAKVSTQRGLNITAAVAPSGDRIALAMSKDGHSQIYLITPQGKQVARLTNSNALEVSPTWSPDGKRIAFVSDRLGKPQIFVMDADGATVRRLTTSGSYNVEPRWSPKGDKIAYCRQTGGGFQIFLTSPDGGDSSQITSEGNNEHPRWSPDGRFITFSSRRGGKEALYVMRADGTGQVKVSRNGGNDTHPVWSPRGL